MTPTTTATKQGEGPYKAVPMNREIWRVVAGYDFYEVSNFGRVRSWVLSGNYGTRRTTPKVLAATQDSPRNYPRVTLSGDGFFIHRLVAITFLGPVPSGLECNHKDGNKANARLDNIEYITRSQNAIHAIMLGLAVPVHGESHSSAKLREADAIYILKSAEPPHATSRSLTSPSAATRRQGPRRRSGSRRWRGT